MMVCPRQPPPSAGQRHGPRDAGHGDCSQCPSLGVKARGLAIGPGPHQARAARRAASVAGEARRPPPTRTRSRAVGGRQGPGGGGGPPGSIRHATCALRASTLRSLEHRACRHAWTAWQGRTLYRRGRRRSQCACRAAQASTRVWEARPWPPPSAEQESFPEQVTVLLRRLHCRLVSASRSGPA
jgi:hypothetical protein